MQVMPQTVSAVQTILEFGLPAVVAVTKADTCPSNLDTRVTAICNQLLEHGLFTEAVGGDVPVSGSD